MSSAEQTPQPSPAELYEAVLVKDLFRPLSAEVLRVAPPQPGDRVIDIACGTGIILREASQVVPQLDRLAGIDINPMMIEVAESIADNSGLNAEWRTVSADALPFESNSFDLAYCQQGLQFFPDPLTALSETHRVLDSGGRLVAITWQDIAQHPFVATMNQISLEHTGVEAMAAPFSMGDQDALADLINQAGFRETTIEPATITINWDEPEKNIRMVLMGATAAIPSLQEMSAEERKTMVDQIIANAEPVFAEYSLNGVMTTHWHANVAIARK